MKFRVKKPNIGSFTQKIKNKLKKGEISECLLLLSELHTYTLTTLETQHVLAALACVRM